MDITDTVLRFISDNMFPQFKTWEQLLSDTNKLFKWDRLVKEEYQILYEDGLKYSAQRNYKKAGETFYKAASVAENKKQQETAYKLLYCAWECALCCGNPEPLAEYTKEMFIIYNNKVPQWLVERFGNCGIAYACYAKLTKDRTESAERYRLGGWLLTEYFNRTGDFKNYDKEWIYYVFYGVTCLEVAGVPGFVAYARDMAKHVPKVYVDKVTNAWDMMKIGK